MGAGYIRKRGFETIKSKRIWYYSNALLSGENANGGGKRGAYLSGTGVSFGKKCVKKHEKVS